MSERCRSRRSHPAAFTLIELCVVMTVIVILLAILLPALGAARESARSARCLANLHELGIAHLSYAGIFNNYIVPAEYRDPLSSDPTPETMGMWNTTLVDVGVLAITNISKQVPVPANPITSTVFYCPSGDSDAKSDGLPHSLDDVEARRPRRSTSTLLKATVDCWYGINGATSSGGVPGKSSHSLPGRRIPPDNDDNDFQLARMSDVPADIVLLYDGVFMNQSNVDPFRVNGRHKNGTMTNLLFVGGHAESVARRLLPGGTTLGYVDTPSTVAVEFTMPTVAQKFGRVRWILPSSLP